MTGITVIVPVYKGLQTTRNCILTVLDSLSEHLGLDVNVLIINDASPEPSITSFCQELESTPGVSLISHEFNVGFVASVNEGMRLAAPTDVVLLNSDTEVPHGWLSRIRDHAERHSNAATLTPFSNNGTICSYPDMCTENPIPKGLSVAELDALFCRANAGKVCELPTAVGFCMYIRRAAIDDVGYFDEEAFGRGYGEENDFCLRATANGWKHLLAADVFVAHAGGASFGTETMALKASAIGIIDERYPNYSAQVGRFIEMDPIRSLREAVDTERLGLPGQAEIVLLEARDRHCRLELQSTANIKERDDIAAQLELELARVRATAKTNAEAYEKQLDQLKDYSQGLSDEIKRLELQLAAYDARCHEYDARCREYEKLLTEAREAYRRLEADAYSIAADRDVLSREKTELENMLGVKIQRRLEKIRGTR